MEYYRFTITRNISNRPPQVSYYSIPVGNEEELQEKMKLSGDFRWVK